LPVATLQESQPILDEVIDGLDDAFESACSIVPGTDSNYGTHTADDEASIQELFCQIAATYSVPLKNLIFALRNHTATKNNIEFCRPILHSIRSAAETINLSEAVQRMEQFDTALAEGQSCADLFLKDKIRMKILDAYGALAAVLPATFQFGEESQKREDIIIHSLLQQIPGVGRLTFEKLSRSGLASLSMLLSANPEDLAAATGIKRKLCVKICNEVQDYSKRAEQRASQTSQSGYHSRLDELVNKLRKRSNKGKTGVASGSSSHSSHQGRTRRLRRNQILLEVNVILAELGELDLIFQLQKASPKRQIQILNQLLPG
jgi:HPt (histidine-containing phosphotransfer) domain-containing protein